MSWRRKGDAVDIADWLRGLGLEKYASAFDENAINCDVLSELTTADLKDIGVAAVGDRRRLLAAIAALGEGASPAAPAPLPSSAAAEAERRQLTVMFCDLVGSPGSPHDSTLRICARSSPPIIAPSLRSFAGSTALSRNTWATESWLISATRGRMRTMPSGRYERVSVSSMRWAGSTA